MKISQPIRDGLQLENRTEEGIDRVLIADVDLHFSNPPISNAVVGTVQRIQHGAAGLAPAAVHLNHRVVAEVVETN